MGFRGQIKNEDEARALDELRRALAAGKSVYSVSKKLNALNININSTRLYRWARAIKKNVPKTPEDIDPAKELREQYIHIKTLRDGSKDTKEQMQLTKDMIQILQRLSDKGLYSQNDVRNQISQMIGLWGQIVSRFLEQELIPILGREKLNELLGRLDAEVQKIDY